MFIDPIGKAEPFRTSGGKAARFNGHRNATDILRQANQILRRVSIALNVRHETPTSSTADDQRR